MEQKRAHDTRDEQLLKGDSLQLPEYQKGNGFSEGIKAFAEKSGLSSIASKILRTALKPLSNKLDAIVIGEGLILISESQDAQLEQLLKGDGLQLPEYKKGNSFSEGIKSFSEKTGLSSAASKILRTALKHLSNKLDVIVKGEGLILISKLQ